jgi:hypothetical protein
LQHEVAENRVMAMVAQQDETPNPEDGERVLRSFQEWMVQRAQKAGTIHSIDRSASSDRSNKQNTDCGDAPSIAPPETLVEPSQRIRIERIAYARPSVTRRVLRTGVRGFVLAVILGIVWQVGRDDRAREFIATFWLSLSPTIWSSVVRGGDSQSGSDLDGAQSIKSLPGVAKAGNPSGSTVAAADSSSDTQQQLQKVLSELSLLRGIIEQFAGRQEQISRDLAMLQVAAQSVNEKVASLAQTSVTRGSSRNSAPKLSHAGGSEQPSRGSTRTLQP